MLIFFAALFSHRTSDVFGHAQETRMHASGAILLSHGMVRHIRFRVYARACVRACVLVCVWVGFVLWARDVGIPRSGVSLHRVILLFSAIIYCFNLKYRC